MKKHLTIIAMAAMAFLASCSSSDQNTAPVAVQDEKPKVKIANSTVEDVEQLHEFTTTVEAEVKNNISPSSNLRISKIYAEVGDNVTKGQKLVQLDASGLEQLALQIENQKIEFNRINELYKVGGASKAELDNAKTALDVNLKAYNNKLENTVMLSPISGVVTARNYDNGDMSGAAPILVIEQIAPVKMNINVSEPYYAKIDKKTPVSVQFEAYGEEAFPATVSIVYPTIDAATHTFPVELKIANKDRKVRPGMYGRATVNFGTKSHVVVPDQAVIKQLGTGDYYVYVYNAGKVSYNKVELGRRMGDKYEIVPASLSSPSSLPPAAPFPVSWPPVPSATSGSAGPPSCWLPSCPAAPSCRSSPSLPVPSLKMLPGWVL